MKIQLWCHYFDSNDDIIAAVDHFLEVPEGVHMIHDCWPKCVVVGGSYVEKLIC